MSASPVQPPNPSRLANCLPAPTMPSAAPPPALPQRRQPAQVCPQRPLRSGGLGRTPTPHRASEATVGDNLGWGPAPTSHVALHLLSTGFRPPSGPPRVGKVLEPTLLSRGGGAGQEDGLLGRCQPPAPGQERGPGPALHCPPFHATWSSPGARHTDPGGAGGPWVRGRGGQGRGSETHRPFSSASDTPACRRPARRSLGGRQLRPGPWPACE